MTRLQITARHPKALSAAGTPAIDAPGWLADIDNPYLHGLFAPVCSETTSGVLPHEGLDQADFSGAP